MDGMEGFIQYLRGVDTNTGAFMFLVLYVVILFVARWLWIVRPSNSHLHAQLDMVRSDLEVAAARDESTKGKEEARIIEGVLERVEKSCAKLRFVTVLVGNSGALLYGWRMTHKAERLLVFLWSPEVVRAQLLVVREKLAAVTTGEGQRLVTEIDRRLKGEGNVSPDPEGDRHLLVAAMEQAHESKDNFYLGLADWNNKVMWLIFTALFIILAIVFKREHNEILLVFGAIGGLLSKLRGVIKRRNVPSDYGASWATLFLTPLVGALTGWTGVLLMVFLKQQGLVGAPLDELSSWWSAHEQAASLALAIAFGFSATFFEKIMERVQGEMEKEAQKIDLPAEGEKPPEA